MATGIHSAEELPDGDYSVSHRTPPPVPVPSVAYANATANLTPPQLLHEPGRPGSEAASVNTEGRKRRGSFGQTRLGSLLRRTSSQGAPPLRSASKSRNSEVPPVPNVPSSATATAHQAEANGVTTTIFSSSGSQSRKDSRQGSFGGRNMLRKTSRMRKVEEQQEQERLRQERQRAPAPKLPSQHPLPAIATFGGDTNTNASDSNSNGGNVYGTYHAHSSTQQPANFSRPGGMPYSNNMHSNNSSSSPAYAIRSTHQYSSSPPSRAANGNGEYVPVDRSESMTNRGRYSYASSTVGVNAVNSPRRIRRRKDPTPFNVLVIGAKNSGKTSFISFLRHSLAVPTTTNKHSTQDQNRSSSSTSGKSSFTSHYLETEMDSERVGLTLYDSAGLEKNIVDLQLREMATFVESKFEETFVEEQKVMRSPGAKDTHIHCAFLLLDPLRLDTTVAGKGGVSLGGGLDDALDVQVMRALWGKTTVIPVIAKADTLTTGHMAFLKRAVWESIKANKLDPLEALELEDELIEEEDEPDQGDGAANEEDEGSNSGGTLGSRSDETDGTEDDESDEIPAPRSKKRHSSLIAAAVKSSAVQGSSARTDSAGADEDLPYIPMSILSPDPYDLPPYTNPKSTDVGRVFPWGTASPLNPTHCDFTRLSQSVFSEWKQELRDLSRTRWYENWRTQRLQLLPGYPGGGRRVKGGVTPVGSIPREGMTSPRPASGSVTVGIPSGGPQKVSGSRQYSGAAAAAAAGVPRSVSGVSELDGAAGGGSPSGGTGTGGGVRSTSKAERIMGVESRGTGVYRDLH